MKQYKIYSNPQGSYEAVKQGWSWPAFFFNCIWAMVKKMWGIGVGVLVSFFAIGVGVLVSSVALGASGQGAGALLDVISIILYIIFGINGNKWRENNLQKRGYDYKNTATAENPEGAIALYMKENKKK